MYKCVDERGVTHYTDKPRPGCKGGEVDIRPIPPAGGRVEPPREDFGQQGRDLKRRQQERERAEAKAKRETEIRCARARNDYLRLDSGRRIVTRIGGKGERTYLDDAERERRLDQLRAEMRGCP